ncbi:hypothetical protein OAZ10_01830 [Acidimicrobiaceae bacterium]|nr:hypothetical protein [Acidimicrobiaceae bacterium]
MSNIFFVTYGDNNYSIQRRRLAHQAKKFKIFKNIFVYQKKDLGENFMNKFSKLMTSSRGGGYWIWKSEIVLMSFNKMEFNDILLYVDSGSTLNIAAKERMLHYIELFNDTKEDIFMFQIDNLIEKNWTTNEIFNFFNVQNNPAITDTPVLMATVFFIRKTKATIDFFKEFQEIVEGDNNLITDYYKPMQNKYFKDCRHDQSIMSVMCKLKGCFFISDESYHLEDPTKQFDFPILTVRDGPYTLWQKIKFFLLYPYNIRKEIYFGKKQFYFKNTPLLLRLLIKMKNSKKINKLSS